MNSREEFLAWADKSNSETLDQIRQSGRYVRYQYARLPGKMIKRHDLKSRLYVGEVYQPGPLTGVFLAVEDANGNLMWGWSSRHPTKEGKPFNKIEGLYRAIKRIGAKPETIPMRNDSHLLIQFEEFMEQSVLELVEKRNERVASPANAGE